MPDIHEIQDTLLQSCGKILTFASKIDAKVEIYPGWTIKELIAHLIGWDEATLAVVESCTDENYPTSASISDVDAYNADTIRRYSGMPFEELVLRWKQIRQELSEKTAHLKSEQLTLKIVFPWGGHDTIARMLFGLAAHDNLHLIDVVNKLN